MGRCQPRAAGPADERPYCSPRPQRGLLHARATGRREPGRGDKLAGADAGADRRSPVVGDRVSSGLPATARQAIVEVDRVRVDVTKLSYDGGLVRTTLLQSASADVALDG